MRNLILTGGIRHDFADNTDAVIKLLSEAGITCQATEDIDTGIARLAAEPFDLVTVMALRWPMEGDPKYAPYREDWAYRMPEDSRRGLQTFVESGGGLLGLHTAALCFDDWAGWGALLGGRWVWGRSHHPPRGTVAVAPTGEAHAITEGISAFSLTDEVFSNLDLAADVTPLMTARAEDQGDWQPALWARSFGKGRVAYDAFGHDRISLEHPQHRRILQRCALWVGGTGAAELAEV